MEGYEDPIRARDEVRKAQWRGAWRMLGAQLLVLVPAAVILPVFYQSKGGPKPDDTWAVAQVIDEVHQKTGRWPAEFREVRSRLHFRGPHVIGFVKIADWGQEAEYAVGVDRRLRAFRLGKGVRALSGRIATGAVGPSPSG